MVFPADESPAVAAGAPVAIVTGASRGLGLAIARELAGRGCRLVICARDAIELRRAVDGLRAAGAEVMPTVCDITSGDAFPAPRRGLLSPGVVAARVAPSPRAVRACPAVAGATGSGQARAGTLMPTVLR